MQTSAPFRDLSIAEFVDRLSSPDPVPGGGSASAVAAALGASLVAMVAALSEGRTKYADHAELYVRVGPSALRLRDELLQLADDDAAAYGACAVALKLPRLSDAERAERDAQVSETAKVAAEIPARCVDACLAVLRIAEQLAGRCNVNAASDLSVATLLVEASARGAAANVLVNLPLVRDETWNATMESAVTERMAEVGRLAALTREVVASGEARGPVDDPAESAAVAG